MSIRFCYKIATRFAAIAFVAGMGQLAFGQNIDVPPVPFDLKPPDGTVVFLEGHARGTQDYICLPSSSGVAWTFFAPQATLFIDINFAGRDIQRQIITHFLSPNPDPSDFGNARATWQSSIDSSAVWAKVFKASTDSAFVATGAIPWLSLNVVGSQPGIAGSNFLTPAVFVQRLNTHGGVAPSTGCSEAAQIGATALVPYSADYFFYRKANQGY